MKTKYEHESGVTIKYEDWKRGLMNVEKVSATYGERRGEGDDKTKYPLTLSYFF
jgi:hypothetical protein